ncbi:hypothetical protein [Xanthomonas translucens]|nr:hypothetical protein [Xanthomonas translucens]MBC3972561.1 hypothetical protein [Xanthomonas translucens pv. undulosa]MCT8281037.1 hypothetical protein [Xanthomonas translucens pv. undulosa]MCT8315849.1 hypothetical protein [Xanthomonas translucens pv. undulosa]QSQ57732.1 hypothetical protein ISN37_07145 [Xanthomonas translucens pv. undulosa]UKE41323.1 hypothetical protein KCU58_09050 [Xanthomonas translucens pv. undulosa]
MYAIAVGAGGENGTPQRLPGLPGLPGSVSLSQPVQQGGCGRPAAKA